MAYGFEEGKLQLISDSSKVSVSEILGDYQGPTYLYDLDDVMRRIDHMQSAFQNKCHMHFALKSNDHPYLLKRLAEKGLGVDIVSGGELRKALEAGFSPDKIVFSGVGKTKDEINLALEQGISQINVESPAELIRIGELAKAKKTLAHVAFRLNPDVNPITHPYIQTGFRENKFGMDSSFFDALEDTLNQFSENLHLKGVTVHIGSQLRDLSASIESVEKAIANFDRWKAKGFKVETLDIGGGIGINYDSLDNTSEFEMVSEYGKAVCDLLKGRDDIELYSEPGRILVGRCGVLITEVQYVKSTPHKSFAIVDTGMHHLMRPALYQASHRILPLTQCGQGSREVYDFVGPICESSDFLAKDCVSQELKQGDLLAICDVGAYGNAPTK